jgi:hypothetical protein
VGTKRSSEHPRGSGRVTVHGRPFSLTLCMVPDSTRQLGTRTWRRSGRQTQLHRLLPRLRVQQAKAASGNERSGRRSKSRVPLVVAKVDRLTRSVAFLSRLLEAGVDVRFADLPTIEGPTGRFMLQQMAAVAELEAGMISSRTKAALAAAKARGKKLGGNRGVELSETARPDHRGVTGGRCQGAAGHYRGAQRTWYSCRPGTW